MQIGKISEPSLKRSVLRPLFGDPALVRYRSGADCAQLPWQEDLLPVYSVVNEVPGFADDPGMLILAAANNLAAGGAKPEGFLVSAVLPPEYEEQWLKADLCRMREAARSCVSPQEHDSKQERGPAVIGGHTQISAAVRAPVYSVTGIGSIAR